MNHYFQFKNFIVYQDRCAMKVCTDACLFGAFVANKLQVEPSLSNDRLFDVGAGTGLLSLMIAQKCNLCIDAIEIDEGACLQANENFQGSPWKERLRVVHQDLNCFLPVSKYQFIVSNPPFFEDDLPSNNDRRNAAKHSSALTLSRLLDFVVLSLERSGTFFLLMPFSRHEGVMESLKKRQLKVRQLTRVRQSPQHDFFRIMYEIGWEAGEMGKSEIVIKSGTEYSADFVDLLKDYYLYL